MPEPRPDDPTRPDTRATAPADQGAKPAEGVKGQPFGRYRLIEKLGKGGMGVVWKAYDTQLKRVVALKQILGEEEPASAERFVREAQAAARLRHPNIVGVYEAGVIEEHHFFTTEYVEGQTLRDVIGAQPLAPKKAIELVKQVAEALAYAHDQGIVHRDVKPENILVDAQGKALVMDFGLAKDMKGELGRNLTNSGCAVGTLVYMSPEQASGRAEAIGPPSDQFSLGVLLYELLAGKLPFDGDSERALLNAIAEQDPVPPTRLNPRLHRDLETICLKALEKDPLRRYGSTAALAADLGRWLEGEPISARPVSRFERLWRRASRHRRVVVPVAALALAALVGVGWAVTVSARKAGDAAKALAAGRAAEDAGNLEGARDAYTAAEALAPSREEAKAGLSRVEGRLREREEADEAARKAKEQDVTRLLEKGRTGLDDAKHYLYDSKANYEELKKRVEVGKKLIEEAIGKAPELALGHDLLGRAWKLLGWDDKAEECWREAIRLDPKFGRAHFQLGMLLLEQATLAKALDYHGVSREELDERAAVKLSDAGKELALAGEPSWAGEDEVPKEMLRVARAFVGGESQRAFDLAAAAVERLRDREGCEWFHVLAAVIQEGDARLAELDSALRVSPGYSLAAELRGIERQMKGDHDGAIADLDKAIAINPRDEMAFLNRGCAHQDQGDLDGAIDDYDHAIAINPRDEDAFLNRGYARQDKSDLDGAVADFDQAIAINPRCAEAFINRGVAREAKGDHDGAIADYDQAIAIDPRSAEAFNDRGIVRNAKGDHDGAIADYDQAIAIDPRDALAFSNRGIARDAKGDHAGAIADYDQAIAIDPRDADVFNDRGLARWNKGDLVGAIADYDQAIAINPRYAEAYSNRGYAREAKGNFEGAIDDYTKALEVAPADWQRRKQAEEQLRTAREKRGK